MKQENISAFIKAVKQMREWQIYYFKYRRPVAMQEAKRWEKEVDRIIAEQEQPVLFK